MNAPRVLYADRGPKGGWMYRRERLQDTEHEYLRFDIVVDAFKRMGVDVDEVMTKLNVSERTENDT